MTTASQASVMRVSGLDARAAASGIVVGMPLAEARALTSAGESLSEHPEDAEADRAALESLAIWADWLSPCVHLEDCYTLLLDMSGTQRLFPDEGRLLKRVRRELRELGYGVRAAMVDTPAAAWAMAHAYPLDCAVAEPGRTVAGLAPLPVWSLRVDERVVADLRALGVETIEALLHLPRSSVAARFGDELLHRLDQALGDVPEPLVPFRAPRAISSRLCIAKPTDRLDVLREALDRVCAGFCEQLEQRVAGVRQVWLTFEVPEHRPITFEQNVSQATRSAGHLRSLLALRLDQLSLRGVESGVGAVVLWARRTEPLDAWQEELFDTGRSAGSGVAHLVDRLVNRLGAAAVVRPVPRDDHQPERDFVYQPLVQEGQGREMSSPKRRVEPALPQSVDRSSLSLRPLRLLARPVEIRVIALAPEGPPSRFEWSGTAEHVVECVGPERLETGWWRGGHVRRDYFRVACRSGRRCWLFRRRDTGRWFLHGWFD